MKDCLVTLIRGPFIAPRGSLNNEPTPAIGLAYIAGSLKAAGFLVEGIDASAEAMDRITPIPDTKLQYNGIGIEEIVARVNPHTRIFGISLMFSHEWNYHKKLIQKLKESFPNAVIIGGGEHATALTEYVLKDCPSLDFCALGEGEETMVAFCERVASGQNPKDIPGIAYREDGGVIQNPPRVRIKNIDELPWPDWDVMPVRVYLDQAVGAGPSFGRSMPMMATRGCPYSCTFCSNPMMWTNKYYMRSVADVIKEIKFYKQKYDIAGIQFYDLTAIVQKQWTKDFCLKMLEENVNLEWSLPSGTRSEALDEENLKLMAQSNCRYLVYAPESGSPETLKLIKKKISLDKMKQSIRTAIRCGIVVRTNMIIGFPHEKRKNIYETLKVLVQFVVMGVEDAPLFGFQPYPGTELFDYLLNKKRIALNESYFDSLATFSNGKLFELPADSYCENVGRLELHLYRLLFGFCTVYFLSYLLHPSRILRTLRNIFSSSRSSTVFEQRIKDRIRKVKPALLKTHSP